jgi:hypothetical protein
VNRTGRWVGAALACAAGAILCLAPFLLFVAVRIDAVALAAAFREPAPRVRPAVLDATVSLQWLESDGHAGLAMLVGLAVLLLGALTFRWALRAVPAAVLLLGLAAVGLALTGRPNEARLRADAISALAPYAVSRRVDPVSLGSDVAVDPGPSLLVYGVGGAVAVAAGGVLLVTEREHPADWVSWSEHGEA